MPYPKSDTSFEIYSAGETTLEISTLIKMVLVVRGFRGKLDEALRRIDQSSARMETLAAIINMAGEKSQSDVAKRLRVEGATVTRMVDLLSKEGLVERKPHPSDRRVNLLSITPRGEEELARIFRVYDRLRSHLLQDMTVAELEQMNALVDKMLGRLDIPLDDTVEIDDLPPVDRLTDKIEGDG